VFLSLIASAAVAAGNPERDAYFGEEHIHTSWPLDAWVMGNRVTGPDDAYKYAQGQAVKHPLGFDSSSSRPEAPAIEELADSLVERRWIDAGPNALAGRRIEFAGLQLTITDVLVCVEMLDGRTWTTIARPSHPLRLKCVRRSLERVRPDPQVHQGWPGLLTRSAGGGAAP
jgi:hypothetical protein